MKAKTIVGMMACAALASAFADPINNNVATTNNQWFVGNVQSSALHADGAAWDNTAAGATVNANSKIEIDNDLRTALTLAPTTNTNSKTAADLASDGLVILSASAYLTPSALVDLPAADTLGDAQVGFAVAVDNNVTNYYAYTRAGTDAGSWFALTGATPPDTETDTSFKIVLDYQASSAKFYVTVNNADTLLSTNAVSSFAFVPVNAKLSNVAAFGSGTITSISGAYENAVAVGKDGKVYGTIAQAYNAQGEGTVRVWDPTNGGAADDQVADNGLSRAVCMALNIAEDAKIALLPAATQNVSGKVVLQTAVAPVENVTVKFTVSKLSGTVEPGETQYNADAIQVPLAAGTYQVDPVVNPAN